MTSCWVRTPKEIGESAASNCILENEEQWIQVRDEVAHQVQYERSNVMELISRIKRLLDVDLSGCTPPYLREELNSLKVDLEYLMEHKELYERT